MTISQPTVSIIIVNYNGSHLLRKCLKSVRSLQYPKKKLEVIVVDNGSTDGSSNFIEQHFPWVKLINCDVNQGFSGGNNVGFEHATGEYVVLLNNDTEVTPQWLSELVYAAKLKNVGIVTSKMLYSIPYLRLKIKTSVIQQSDLDGSSNFGPLGILMEDIELPDNLKRNNDVWYELGFHDKESINGLTLRWTTGDSVVYLPLIDPESNKYRFIFHGLPTTEKIATSLQLKIEDSEILNAQIPSSQVKQFEIEIKNKDYRDTYTWLVQNAGNVVLRNGYSKDRGSLLKFSKKDVLEFYEQDSLYFSKACYVLGGCGAGMLIKREVLDAIGTFDGHYFMYYEDVDFSLRAWRMGWDIVYSPRAVIYHAHRATTGKEESPFTINLTERNHLFLIMTHFPLKTCMIEYLLFLVRLSGSFFMQAAFQFVRLSKYSIWRAKAHARLKALNTFHQLLPVLIKNRLFWRKRQKRSYSQLEKYMY